MNKFLGTHICKFVGGRFLSSYTNQSVLMKQKQQCNQQGVTSNKTSIDSHLYWERHFHRNPLNFRTLQILKLTMKLIILV